MREAERGGRQKDEPRKRHARRCPVEQQPVVHNRARRPGQDPDERQDPEGRHRQSRGAVRQLPDQAHRRQTVAKTPDAPRRPSATRGDQQADAAIRPIEKAVVHRRVGDGVQQVKPDKSRQTRHNRQDEANGRHRRHRRQWPEVRRGTGCGWLHKSLPQTRDGELNPRTRPPGQDGGDQQERRAAGGILHKDDQPDESERQSCPHVTLFCPATLPH